MNAMPAHQADPISAPRVREILARIERVSVAVCGDFCLDAYWMLNPRGGEISAETGLRAQAVGRHYYSLGGAANVVANAAALRPAHIRAVGIVGDDVFGRELLRQLRGLGVETAGMVVQHRGFDTVTYGKRYGENGEEPRIDFGFFNERSADTDAAVLSHLRGAIEQCDVTVFNQQIPGGLAEPFISGLNDLFEAYPDKIVVCDSRHYGSRFRRVHRKTNDVEAARLNGIALEPAVHPALPDLETYAARLYAESGRPVFVTRGARGILTVDDTGVHLAPGIQVLGRTDTVGAGDTVTGALALCLGAGLPPAEAAGFANLAAAVTVQKIFQTGTASPEEVLAAADDTDYVYQPELADDVRQAAFLDGSEIEACCHPLPRLSRVRHAVFDHDGTISTLRQGWEEIMEPMMIRAILGERYASADETLYHRVAHRVRDYIDKSTGIETLVQMAALVDMVREFGVVPPRDILDTPGYKAIYNDALMAVVDGRLAKFRRGELDIDDVTVKGAVPFLRALRDRGVTLYLASGTDEADVRREAGALGYADLFDGGIYGALDRAQAHAKRRVIQRILSENGLDGSRLAVFGDGPVELREARKRHGAAVGVASDEVRRYGLSPGKRARLVKAGAHLVIPDFSQAARLLALMRDDDD
jgi:bifunctional ADP-heptose synthase (sugar kinase/adenylyltransferase)/phosphoglycolate phosphatase-like HAD superfamily hydrolase